MLTNKSKDETLFQVRSQLGCQMWLELTDSAERINDLFAKAAESGLGWIRLFLMWPWIEPKPGEWDFTLFDRAFEAAAKHNIRIKATLTANSGPWHIGTPSMLHSHTGFLSAEQREPMRRYIQACVERYREHTALGQWILWNEPRGTGERTEEGLIFWRQWLQRAYSSDIAKLNQRWRTGYSSFTEIPFPENIPHPAQRGYGWNSYAPWMAEWQFRSAWLIDELTWVKDRVREFDLVTPTCFNPSEILTNHALNGLDFPAMGEVAEVIGASYHPVWHFNFAERAHFPALMVAGIRMESSIPTVRQVEVTEVQTGNTLNSGVKPVDATPGEIARYYLVSLAAGASSVTGWCLNTRSYDFEAGDWGLLDNFDQHSARSRMMRQIHDRLEKVYAVTGKWSAAPAQAFVVYDPHSQALEWIEERITLPAKGRLAHDGAQGAALLATTLMQCGIVSTLIQPAEIPGSVKQGDLLILSHLSWNEETAEAILKFAEAGGTVLLDAISGRKDLNATLHRPWPGGLVERLGLRAVDLQSRREGYAIDWHGRPSGSWLLTRLMAELDATAGWEAWPHLRFGYDGEPCVWERTYGQGQVIVARGLLGPTLVHEPETVPALVELVGKASRGCQPGMYPVHGHWSTFTVPVSCEHGKLIAVFSVDILDRRGLPVHLHALQGEYQDLWSGEKCSVGPDQELRLVMADGIALLWQPAE